MAKSKIVIVQNIPITVIAKKGNDFICLTDLAKAKEGEARAADIIKNWIRTRTTLEFIGTWEQMYNPDFKVVEFDHFKMQAGLPSFVLSPGQGISQSDRLVELNKMAITQMKSLLNSSAIKKNKAMRNSIVENENAYLICIARLRIQPREI